MIDNVFSLLKFMICLKIVLWCALTYAQSGVVVLNKGLPGNATSDLLIRVDQDVLKDPPNICVILVGTNDLLNTSKMVTLSEYTSTLSTVIERVIRVGIKPVLISPPPVDTVFLFQRHNRFKYSKSPNQLLEMASDSIAAMCDLKNIPFIDLFAKLRNGHIPDHNRDTIIQNEWNMQVPDGVHFTAEGNELLAELVMDRLVEWKYLSSSVRIVCFGDSLTYGSRMNGAGTSSGNTYPAYLKDQINDWVNENK